MQKNRRQKLAARKEAHQARSGALSAEARAVYDAQQQ